MKPRIKMVDGWWRAEITERNKHFDTTDWDNYRNAQNWCRKANFEKKLEFLFPLIGFKG